jgi:predicted DNA-binding transcriptional regulator YafY
MANRLNAAKIVVGTTVLFTYVDRNGQTSKRIVEVKALESRPSGLMFRAFDLKKQQDRSFYHKRMANIVAVNM